MWFQIEDLISSPSILNTSLAGLHSNNSNCEGERERRLISFTNKSVHIYRENLEIINILHPLQYRRELIVFISDMESETDVMLRMVESCRLN